MCSVLIKNIEIAVEIVRPKTGEGKRLANPHAGRQLSKCYRNIIIIFENIKLMNDNSVNPYLAVLMMAASTEAFTCSWTSSNLTYIFYHWDIQTTCNLALYLQF